MKIFLDIKQGLCKLVIINSIPDREIRLEKSKGIGLKNVRKRLELDYNGKHSLEIQKTREDYTVSLALQL